MTIENQSQNSSTNVSPNANVSSNNGLVDQFINRRNGDIRRNSPGLERRQFSDSHSNLSPEAAALGHAIDQYKLENRRRFISYEEMLNIIKGLGYSKS